jgi:hypothetical protein
MSESIVLATSSFRAGTSIKGVLDIIVQVRVHAAVQRSMAIVAEHARANVPVMSGELQSSIHVGAIENTGQQVVGTVVADAGHAAFVELGTGIRGRGTYPYPLPQQGVPYTGSWVYDYKRQNWIGGEARPFMRPGLESARTAILREFQP